MTEIAVSYKFGALFVAAIVIYATRAWPVLLGFLVVAVLVLLTTRTPVARLARLLAGLVAIVAAFTLATGLPVSWGAAAVSALRLLSLSLLAYAVTLTTRFSQMLQFFERLLAPTRRIGLNPARMSLALAMAVRFIPEVRTKYLEVREAQFARGRQNNPVALMIPLLVRTLQAAQDIAAAIDARCYDSDVLPDPRR